MHDGDPAPRVATILVIDDDDAMRRMIARVLAQAGHRVLAVGNGREGLEAFRAHSPDLVITDIVMPEKEGIETMRELRRDSPATPVLVISGAHPTQGGLYLRMALTLGATAVLAKPFRADQLAATVRDVLAG